MKQIIKYCGLYKSSHQLSEKKNKLFTGPEGTPYYVSCISKGNICVASKGIMGFELF